MRVVVQHRSRYHYPRPARPGPQPIRLRSADHTRARIETISCWQSCSIACTGCASNLTEQLLSLVCVDAGESRDVLDVFSA